MQSPTMTRADSDSRVKRGALRGAPRRDSTMTQDSDSGDAAGDAGPTTDTQQHDRFRFKFAYSTGGKALRRRMILRQRPAKFAARERRRHRREQIIEKPSAAHQIWTSFGARATIARELRADEEEFRDALGRFPPQ